MTDPTRPTATRRALGRIELLFSLALVSAVRYLVPRRRRRTWIAEWRGEILHSWSRSGSREKAGGPSLLRRASSSIPHALTLLRHEWSPDMLLQDIKYAFRRLSAHAAFTLVAISTLAIGIGANTAIFSVINSTLIRPIPYPGADRLVHLWKRSPNESFMVSPDVDDVELWRTRAESLEAVEGYNGSSPVLTGGEEPVQAHAMLVAGTFFSFLGIEPVLGRGFRDDESSTDARVSVISHGLWRERFGGDRGVLGERLELDGEPYTVIGVMPREFHFPGPFEDARLWLPLTPVEDAAPDSPLLAIARLRPGVTVEAANDELEALAAAVKQEDGSDSWPGVVSRPQDMLGAKFRESMFALQGAVGLVLLIACANVANLLLSRAVALQHETAIRSALGAGRGRLFRQLVTEHLLLALAGGAVGLGLAHLGIRAMVALQPEGMNSLDGVRVDGTILAFTFFASVLTGLMSGILPALQASRSDVVEPLKGGVRQISGHGRRSLLRGSLVVAEVGLSVMLLVAAGLLLTSLGRLLASDLGFDTENVLRLSVSLPDSRYPETSQRVEFRRQLEDRVRTADADRIISLALANGGPAQGGVWFGSFQPEGRAPVPGFDNAMVGAAWVSPEFFETLRIPFVDGRPFVAADTDAPENPMIVNTTWARRMFGAEKATGQRVVTGDADPTTFTIVGVVADTKFQGPASTDLDLQAFMPFRAESRSVNLLIRMDSDPAAYAAALKEQVWALDPDLPIESVAPLDGLMAGTVARQRFNAVLMTTFAAVALILALIGVYGVLVYSVGQRRREISLRVALGAARGDVLPMVIWQGMRPVLVGLVVGVCAALAATRVLESLLYGVSAANPTTYAIVAGTLLVVAFAACSLPARRAARVDPMLALRG